MTSMQIEKALSENLLIPWQKSEPERFKTALDLLRIDKGGLTFQPPVGIFANVAEIDFVAMYPSLMVTRNISPETVLCDCCDNHAVPEADYNVCEKRRGLIPLTLAPLIERRQTLAQDNGGRRATRRWARPANSPARSLTSAVGRWQDQARVVPSWQLGVRRERNGLKIILTR